MRRQATPLIMKDIPVTFTLTHGIGLAEWLGESPAAVPGASGSPVPDARSSGAESLQDDLAQRLATLDQGMGPAEVAGIDGAELVATPHEKGRGGPGLSSGTPDLRSGRGQLRRRP